MQPQPSPNQPDQPVGEGEQLRIKDRLKQAGGTEPAIEMTFSLRNPWSHRLFVALCRRYGLRAYRYRRIRYTSVCARAPNHSWTKYCGRNSWSWTQPDRAPV